MTELQWIVLGAALGNRTLHAHVQSELTTYAFAYGRQRQLFAAMGSTDRAGVEAVLSDLGSNIQTDRSAIESVLATVRRYGERERQKAMAEQLRCASLIGRSEDFAALLARFTDELAMSDARQQVVAGRIGDQVAI